MRTCWLAAFMRICGIAAFMLLLACRERRDPPEEPLTFDAVQPLLSERCVRCHGEAQRAAGVSLASYYDALGCTSQGIPLSSSKDAPILSVLARSDHAFLSPGERALLERWVDAGAPGGGGVVHGPDILDPRSPGWHGTLAGERNFAPLQDPASDLSCGRCHDDAPARPEGVNHGVPGAPACSQCHQEPGGVLACGTCHGSGERAYPPRDACYFGASLPDAHHAHVTGTRFRAHGLACSACHPVPGARVLGGTHANGQLELAFAQGAGFDAARETCAVGCHARGGTDPEPAWRSPLALDCQGCHLSPPRDHYPGSCGACHAQMGPGANDLLPGLLHLNGTVDMGSGSGSCGACHGEADDPWPRDQVHRAHRDTELTSSIRCDTCHRVPERVMTPGHLDGRVQVELGPRARFSEHEPAFDVASKRCSSVACHAGPLQAPAPDPVWSEAPTSACTSCHGAPPPAPHVAQQACGGGLCHGAQVHGSAPALGITTSGRALHIDGALQVGRD